METKKRDLSYYRLYLQHVLQSRDMTSLDDDVLDERSAAAEEEYENARREGLTVVQAQERAVSVLLENII